MTSEIDPINIDEALREDWEAIVDKIPGNTPWWPYCSHRKGTMTYVLVRWDHAEQEFYAGSADQQIAAEAVEADAAAGIDYAQAAKVFLAKVKLLGREGDPQDVV